MKAVIVLNGEPCDYLFLGDEHVVACDGAYDYLTKNGVKSNVSIGDFDSLGFIPENAVVYPREKDFTDGELALSYCVERGIEEIDFICGGGGRDDHFFGNISVLLKASSLGVTARLFTANSVIYPVSGEISVRVERGTTVSFVAVTPCVVSFSRGLKYLYPEREITIEDTLGLSNVATENEVTLKLKKGKALLFVNRKPV